MNPLGVCVKARRVIQTWEELQTPGEAELTAGSRSALEGALRLSDETGVDVVVFGLGDAGIQTALRACLAGGAKRAVHLCTNSGVVMDGWSTAVLLAQALKRDALSVIICGEDAGTDFSGEVPAFLAEILGLPLVTRTVRVRLAGDGSEAHLQRSIGRGKRENLTCTLPFIASLVPSAYPPRYLSVYQRNREDCGVLEILAVQQAPGRTICLGIDPLRLRARKIAAPEAAMSAAERMKFLLSGGKRKPDAGLAPERIFEGSPEEAAERLYEFLDRSGFLSTRPGGSSDWS